MRSKKLGVVQEAAGWEEVEMVPPPPPSPPPSPPPLLLRSLEAGDRMLGLSLYNNNGNLSSAYPAAQIAEQA